MRRLVCEYYGGFSFGNMVRQYPHLRGTLVASLADPAIKSRLADLGDAPVAMSSVAFGKYIADETTKWATVIKTAGIKAQ